MCWKLRRSWRSIVTIDLRPRLSHSLESPPSRRPGDCTREVNGFPWILEAFPLLSHAFNCQRGQLLTFVFGDVAVQTSQAPRSCPAVSPQKGMHFHVAWAVVGLEIVTVSYRASSLRLAPQPTLKTFPRSMRSHARFSVPNHFRLKRHALCITLDSSPPTTLPPPTEHQGYHLPKPWPVLPITKCRTS